jgi:hypothetical protein
MTFILEQQPAGTESRAEKIQSAAETIPERQDVVDKAGLERLGEEIEETMDSESARVLAGADYEMIPHPSLEIDSQTAQAVLERGNFGTTVQNFKDRILGVTQSAKQKIADIISSKPEPIHFATMAETSASESAEKTVAPVAAAQSAEVGSAGMAKEKPEETVEETAEQKETRELREYLESEVFAKFGLTKEAEEQALAEVPEARREILARSFENMRASLEIFYDTQAIKGRIDWNAKEKAERRLAFETLAPILESSIAEIQPKLALLGIELSLSSLGFSIETADPVTTDMIFDEVENRVRLLIKKKAEQQIDDLVSQKGEYQGIVMPTEEQRRDTAFMAGQKKLYGDLRNQLIAEITQETGFPQWEGKTRKKLEEPYELGLRGVPDVDGNQFRIRTTKEEVTASLERERDIAERTNFLCVNIDFVKMGKVLDRGGFRDIFSLSKQELADMNREEDRGGESYMNQRTVTEQALGIYDVDRPTIYGTYACENGIDEKVGGADMYGGIFLKLKPNMEAVYCEGDSMSGSGGIAEIKLEKMGIRGDNWVQSARLRQIAPEHAALAKGMMNAHRKTDARLGRPADALSYLEAHIKGLTLTSIDSINVPQSYIDGLQRTSKQGGFEIFMERLQQDPAWKDKINIVE